MLFLAPVLSKVLEAAQCLQEGQESTLSLTELVPQAMAFVQEGIQLFRLMSPGILRTPEVEELFRQIQLEQQAQYEALQALGRNPSKHSLARHVPSLRSASQRLLELFPKLHAEEAKEKVYSPFPVLDHSIRVGINLLDGKVELVDFQSRLPSVAGLIASLRQDVERFRLLYANSALAAQALPHLERMEAGLGAGYLYLGNQDKAALQDSLRLLGSAGVKLMELLQQFDSLAKQQVKFHSLRFIEELGRAAELGQPAWLLSRAWSGLEQGFDYYRLELERIAQSPIFFEFEGRHREAQAAYMATAEALRGIDRAGPIPAGLVAKLDAPFTHLDQIFQKLQTEVGSATIQYQNAPNIDQLRELIGRTLKGEFSGPQFLEELRGVQERHQEMLTSLQNGSSDALIEELIQLTQSHSMAYARMQLYGVDLDRDHLVQSWRLISLTLPRILELSGQLKQRMGGKSSSGPSGITCFRCGTENAKGQKFCKSCQGKLPQVDQEVTDYTDIIGGSEPEAASGGTPANLAKLEQLLRQAELGQISRPQLREEMDQQLRNAEKVRFSFEKQVINKMGKDPTFDAYAQFFAMQMSQFVQGLFEMQSYADGAPSSALREGFMLCLAAGQELQAFQGKIQESMRGTR